MLQPEFDRPELRKLVGQAKESLASISGDKRRSSFVYSPDADHMGDLENKLESFWKPSLSRIFASEGQTPVQRPAATPDTSEKGGEGHGAPGSGAITQ